MSLNWNSYSSRVTSPRCGVHTTLSIPTSGCCAPSTGSSSCTSTAALPGRPPWSAAASAPGSTSPARLVLTKSAVGFMRERSAAVTMPRVASTRRRWSVITSHSAKNASRLAARRQPAAAALSRDASRAHTSTSIPNARA